MARWIEDFQCGCSHEVARKKDLVGYCGLHGDSRCGLYKIEKGAPVAWTRDK